MGLLSSTIRVQMLNSQKLDLQYRVMLITQSLSTLSSSMADLQTVGTDYTDSESVEAKKLKARLAELQALEKKLNAQMDQYKTKLQMIDSELESANQMRQQAIEKTFKY